MALRASKFDFGRSLFSTAGMAHANYLHRNPRTLLTGDGQGGFNPLAPVERLPAKESAVEEPGGRSSKLNQLTGVYFDAWANDDRDGQIEAARELVSEMVGIHKLSGVPLFAHSPVPWDFVEAVKAEVDGVPEHQRAAVVKDVVDTFEPSVRPGLARQFAAHRNAFGHPVRAAELSNKPIRVRQRQSQELRGEVHDLQTAFGPNRGTIFRDRQGVQRPLTASELAQAIPVPADAEIPWIFFLWKYFLDATGTKSERDCAEEWEEAYKMCANEFSKPERNRNWGVTGNTKTLYQCAKGLVSSRCGGNAVEIVPGR